MTIPKYEFMQKEWGFSKLPISTTAFNQPGDTFSADAAREEVDAFEERFVAGGIWGGLVYGYLWSAPGDRVQERTGTGYGKTALMREMERRLNADFGERTLARFHLPERPSVAAAYTKLDNEDTRGVYALLCAAVERWADAAQCSGPGGRSVFEAARDRIVARLGCAPEDESAVRAAVEVAYRGVTGGATASPLRREIVEKFCMPDPTCLQEELAGISTTAKARRGLDYFIAAVTCLSAAGIEHVFLFIDQLEYMVTNRSMNRNQKSREVARLRSVFTEHACLADRVHVIFTLHRSASGDLSDYWTQNRLPPFEWRDPENRNVTVVLRGLESPERIGDLVRPYFDKARRDSHHPLAGTLAPLDPATFPVLLERSQGRPGVILRRVASALDRACEENKRSIDAALLERILGEPIPEEEAPVPAVPVDASGLIE